jgi:cytochrome c biogenesis protein CcmG, thiol:disulfide interchange protein DsbE
MTSWRATRRGFLSGAAALSTAACVPQQPLVSRTAKPDPSSHPLDDLLSFDGLPLEPPAFAGHITVVDFWASWCGPCRQAFRHLDQLYRTYKSQGLQMWAVSLDENPQAGRGFVARLRPGFTTAWDHKGLVSTRFSVLSLPTTVLLDDKGQVVHRVTGFELSAHKTLESHVRGLVASL